MLSTPAQKKDEKKRKAEEREREREREGGGRVCGRNKQESREYKEGNHLTTKEEKEKRNTRGERKSSNISVARERRRGDRPPTKNVIWGIYIWSM